MKHSLLPETEARNWAMGVHLASFAGFIVPFGGLLGPLALWLLKKDYSPFVDLHGKAALNFQISMLIWFLLSGLLCLILIGFLLLLILVILDLVFTILNMIRASNGQLPSYPLTIPFLT